MRQEPKALSESVAHRLGTSAPAVRTACITLVPTGTSTGMPSTVRWTVRVTLAASGVLAIM
jgi:hypothetical protein